MDKSPSSPQSQRTFLPFIPPRVDEMASSTPGRNAQTIGTPDSRSSSPPSTIASTLQRAPATSLTDTNAQSPRDPHYVLKLVPNIVKSRSGSVLSRNTILKMDHVQQGTNAKLDFHLQGAPNFRSAALDVYGVAQPTVVGLSVVLALLNCHPNSLQQNSCTWFLTREEPLLYLNGNSYALRDYADPMQNMSAFLGINADRLEQVEERLKYDVLKEIKTMGGLLLVHQELADGTLVPCYIAADRVQTPKEVFRDFQDRGYRLKYFRIPISPMQAPEENYFDEYVRVIKNLEPTDPLVFNCGMGVVRTTVGMIMAQIIRRTQLIVRRQSDPFPIPGYSYTSSQNRQIPISHELLRGLEEVDTVNAQNRILLRLVYVLEQALNSKMSARSAIEWALERGNLIGPLKEALLGNYQSVVSLTSVLDNGVFCKKMLDEVVNLSDAVVNLREDILMNRIQQSAKSTSQYDDKDFYLSKALASLQRYFSLLCFTSYINSSPNTQFDKKFSTWIKERSEIWATLQHLRTKGPQYYFFRPVDDLRGDPMQDKLLSKSFYGSALGMFSMVGAGAQSGIVPGEVEEYILQARTGIVLTSQTILKIDFWRLTQSFQDEEQELSPMPTPTYSPETLDLSDSSADEVRRQSTRSHHTFFIEGASNFRHIKHTHVYGVAQPTIDGLRKAIQHLLSNNEKRPNRKLIWINLREEPIIYINGIPYVLRDRYFTLRNIRTYKGITGERLEQLETRLKEDVLREVANGDGRIMLHGEDRKGDVMAAWEEVAPADVLTVREVMESVATEVKQYLSTRMGSNNTDEAVLLYHRVPMTAEKVPDAVDFDELRHILAPVDLASTAIVLNCQMGVGRSTMGTVMATLLTRWMKMTSSITSSSESVESESDKRRRPAHTNYQLINSLLRVIKNGQEVKAIVDDAIDMCGSVHNLRESIQSIHVAAESEEDEAKQRRIVKRGVIALKRYFMLICFEAYLESTLPGILEETESFAHWVKRHQELQSILQEELSDDSVKVLVPVDKSIGDGVALSSEVMHVVNARHGQVLVQQTILKQDAFPGCQKMTLKEKIDGAFNYRRVEVRKVKNAIKYPSFSVTAGGLAADMARDENDVPVAPFICGCGMPSKDGIQSVLRTMDAGPGGKRRVLWTCLREEPVLYVNKQPYVLRLFSDPVKNLITTGIARERVEGMEHRMKMDVLKELTEYDGRVLLHDEEAGEKGDYSLVAIWETVPPDCVETPKEVFQSMVDEGYQVDYLRIPITDEQAPIPDVFDQLINRTKDAGQGIDMLFNCQMGRGRTTTGMVTACLMAMILNNDSVVDMSGSFIADTDLGMALYDGDKDEAYEERERYQNGEYKIVIQLVSVLTYGKLAKRLVDHAINMCDHMQNLRQAIYDIKIRLESMEDHRTPKWRATRVAAINYLVRYFYLIVFANYLLEEMGTTSMSGDDDDHDDDDHDDDHDGQSARGDKIVIEQEARRLDTFSSWLKDRREITNIILPQNLDLS